MAGKWLMMGWGRDWLRQIGHSFDLLFIARPDLTLEGRIILSAVRIHAETKPFRVWINSDAREIAERNLALASIPVK